MKKLILFSSMLLLAVSFSFAQQGPPPPRISLDVIIGNRPPNPNERQVMMVEEQRHPNVAKAMHDIEKSMHSLDQAPDEFGGHKAQAQADLKQAYISLRKALYYRLYSGGY
jgi:hypothetical protein